MTSDEFKKLTNQFSEQGKMNFLEGATEEQLTQFEKEKNIILPSKFKEWLLFCDGGEFFLPAGAQMYGIVHKPIIDIEDNCRPDAKYIVIGRLASGDPILCENNQEKIYVYDLEAGELDEELTYGDFIAFLNDLYDLLGIGE